MFNQIIYSYVQPNQYLSPSSPGESDCPDYWVKVKDECLRVELAQTEGGQDSPMTWIAARVFCQSFNFGADLAIMDDSEILEAFYDYVAAHYPSTVAGVLHRLFSGGDGFALTHTYLNGIWTAHVRFVKNKCYMWYLKYLLGNSDSLQTVSTNEDFTHFIYNHIRESKGYFKQFLTLNAFGENRCSIALSCSA